MKSLWKNYKSSIVLLGAILLGGIVGATMGEKATVLKPIGELFLNLLFMTLVPLVFFSVTSAIANMSGMNRLGKILKSIVIVFLGTGLVAAIVGLIGVMVMNPTKGLNREMFSSIIESASQSTSAESVSVLQQIVNTFTVNDFQLLLSKSNMLQLIVFSILFGIATAMTGEVGKPIAKFVEAGSAVMMKIISIIMMAAPIGLGCYFANVIGELGSQLLSGYVRVTVLYIILTAVMYFGVFTLYAFIAGGKDGIKMFWANAIAPTVTSLATCSSAASIPVNLDATKNMGVPDDIVETVIPLGANIHKDGSVVTGVLKIVFLLGLLGTDINNPGMILAILGVAFINGAVMGAIPGGGFMSEMLIISIFGMSPELLPIIVVIGTILDAPATLLNSTENTVSAMLVARLVEGKDWLKNPLNMKIKK